MYPDNFTNNCDNNLYSSMRENNKTSTDILSSPPLLTAIKETLSWFSLIKSDAYNLSQGLNDASSQLASTTTLSEKYRLSYSFDNNPGEVGLIAITGLIAIYSLSYMLTEKRELLYTTVIDKGNIYIAPKPCGDNSDNVRIIISIEQRIDYTVHPEYDINKGFININPQEIHYTFFYNVNDQRTKQDLIIDIPSQRLEYRHNNSNKGIIFIPSISQTMVYRNNQGFLNNLSQETRSHDYDVDTLSSLVSTESSEGVTQKQSWSESTTTICESPKQMSLNTTIACESPKQMSLDTTICESPKQMSFSSKDTTICESPEQASFSTWVCKSPKPITSSNESTTLVFDKNQKPMSWSKSTLRKLSKEGSAGRCSWDNIADSCLFLYLEENKDKIKELNKHNCAKEGLWRDASLWMKVNGYPYSMDQCFNRWKNKTQDYRSGILNDQNTHKSIKRIFEHIDHNKRKRSDEETGPKDGEFIHENPGQEYGKGKKRKIIIY
ncbi:uncharacterized protein OCT59_017026 [Rhizophagus irregularis]|nr:hypothetical protein OCT59_017026 [Rhizophagus irregularis]CAG8538912.1 22718_t:CDS:10 [Rhizophagus irregularis]